MAVQWPSYCTKIQISAILELSLTKHHLRRHANCWLELPRYCKTHPHTMDASLPKPADAIISFSVLEHVYDRLAYLKAAKRNLGATGKIFINYDAGHFILPLNTQLDSTPGSLKRLVRRLVEHNLRMSVRWWRRNENSYLEKFVNEQDFVSAVRHADLTIIEQKSFNTALKSIYKLIPAERRNEFQNRWLEMELFINECGAEYRDDLAPLFTTRNFILTHRPELSEV